MIYPESDAVGRKYIFFTITVKVTERQYVTTTKKPGLKYQADISATRLSAWDPGGFPSHPRGWFSIIVYHSLYSIV